MLNTDLALFWDFKSNNGNSNAASSDNFCQIGLTNSRAQVASNNWKSWAAADTDGTTGFSIATLLCPDVQASSQGRMLRTSKGKSKTKKSSKTKTSSKTKKSKKAVERPIKQCQKNSKTGTYKETTSDVVQQYVENDAGQSQFQKDFIAAWNKMASLGYHVESTTGIPASIEIIPGSVTLSSPL